MGRKSVAVLDVRSTEVAIVVGEKGVNNTFVIKASKTEPYAGYGDGKFDNEQALAETLNRAVAAVEKTCGERVRTLYVGVPGEFSEVVAKGQEIGFSKKHKITEKDVSALLERGKEDLLSPEDDDGPDLTHFRFMRSASVIYTTSDNRRVVDPVGLTSTSLDGALSYFFCSDYFADTMENIFRDSKIELRFLPAEFAMATYLIPSQTRDEYALFLDSGKLSTTICVLLGNGALAQKTYWVGTEQIAFLIADRFGLPTDAAEALLLRANLYSKGNAGTSEFMFRGKAYEIDFNELSEVVKEGLDEICEALSGFLENCSGKEFDYKPLYVSGEGVTEIRGALEHMTRRIDRVCEQLVPNLPYFNKPSMSSRIALIDMAYEDNRKSGLLYRLTNGFGG